GDAELEQGGRVAQASLVHRKIGQARAGQRRIETLELAIGLERVGFGADQDLGEGEVNEDVRGGVRKLLHHTLRVRRRAREIAGDQLERGKVGARDEVLGVFRRRRAPYFERARVVAL